MISEFDGGAGSTPPETNPMPDLPIKVGPDAKKMFDMTMGACAAGIPLGVMAFIRHRRVDTGSTPKCKDPVFVFVDLLTSEMSDKSKYPFSKSLLKMLFHYLNSEAINLGVLHKAGHDKEMEAFAKFIAMESTLRFLEENLDEALSLFKKIREE